MGDRNKMSLVEKNQYGYWDCSVRKTCILKALLNVLESIGKMDEERAQKIAKIFTEISAQDKERTFNQTHNIPQTIEKITMGEFQGVLVCKNAREYLMRMGAKNVEKYASDIKRMSRSLIPLIGIEHREDHGDRHALAIIEYGEDSELCRVVDNGVLGFRTRKNILYGYRIVGAPEMKLTVTT
jgi:hypothetical protein